MIKWIARPIIHRNFRNEKPSWGLVIDNMRVERRGEHVIQPPTDGARGGSFDEFPPTCCTAWCGGLPRVVEATEGLGYVSQVAAIGGLSLPGACGLSLTCIASNNWGLLSRCLFDETRVESELSSCGAWYIGKGRSWGRSLRISRATPMVPGYATPWLSLEFAPWPLNRWSWGGPEDETWIRNTSFSSLSLLVS